MLNPAYFISRMREVIEEFEPSRERSLAVTKLDECEMWLAKCTPTAKARNRDLAAPAPSDKSQHRPGTCGGPGICVVCSRRACYLFLKATI